MAGGGRGPCPCRECEGTGTGTGTGIDYEELSCVETNTIWDRLSRSYELVVPLMATSLPGNYAGCDNSWHGVWDLNYAFCIPQCPNNIRWARGRTDVCAGDPFNRNTTWHINLTAGQVLHSTHPVVIPSNTFQLLAVTYDGVELVEYWATGQFDGDGKLMHPGTFTKLNPPNTNAEYSFLGDQTVHFPSTLEVEPISCVHPPPDH